MKISVISHCITNFFHPFHAFLIYNNETFSNEQYKDLQCMLLCSPTSVLLAGHQSEMFKMDINTQQHISQVS